MKTLLKIFLLALFLFFNFEITNAQPSITWRKTYYTLAPSGSGLEGIYAIAQTDDGGYIAAGNSRNSSGNPGYMFAMGIGPYGDSLWFRVYNHPEALKILKLDDGNYVILSLRAALVKINPVGDTIWTKFRGYNLGCTDFKYFHNEFYICGGNRNNEKPFLLKLDSLGNDIFYKEYDYFKEGGAVRDIIVNDNDIYLYGNEIIPTFTFLIRTDSMGDVISIRNYQSLFLGVTISKTPFKESIIIGGRESISGFGSAALMKTDTSGNIIWKRTYDPGNPNSGDIDFILNDKNGGIISLGKFFQYPVSEVARLMKFDYDGNLIWRREYGFDNVHYFPYCLIQTTDSGYVIGGIQDEQFPTASHIVKTDKFGNVPVSIQNNNEVVSSEFELYQNYPNPFNASTIIKFKLRKVSDVKISLYDVRGNLIQLIVEGKYNQGVHEILFRLKNLSSGIYFYKIHAGDFEDVKRMLLVK